MRSAHRVILVFVTIIVLGVGVYFIQYYFVYKSYSVNKTDFNSGLSILFKNKIFLEKKITSKFYYINVWNTMCIPCIKELRPLDSLSEKYKDDISFILVSDDTEEKVSGFLKRKNIVLKNVTLINDMNDFISGVCNLKNNPNKEYPMNIIINDSGQVVYFSVGAELLGKMTYKGNDPNMLAFVSKYKAPLITKLDELIQSK